MFWNSLTIVALTLGSTVATGDDHSLEPSINGEVSASGNYPTQEMEEQIYAYLEWQKSQPFYLFRVAVRNLPEVYPED